MAEAIKGPLDGLRVIDLTRVLSGPFCTMILGDLGADVIKIEPPKGDPVRAQGTMTEGHSGYFAGFNRNKRSVVLDLYSDAGKAVLRRLLAEADVLVENFRPGTLDKLGLGEAAVKELNPRLIVASINGYGSTGPYKDRPAFDFIAQAMSGFMGVNGEADGPPMRAAPGQRSGCGHLCGPGNSCLGHRARKDRAGPDGRSGHGERFAQPDGLSVLGIFRDAQGARPHRQ